MFLWLTREFGLFLEYVDSHTVGDSRVFLAARTAGAGMTAFLMAIVFGPMAIHWLRHRYRERIASASATLNELHSGKRNTPTMGGIFMMGAVAFSSLLWSDLTCGYVLLSLLLIAALTVLGAVDDRVKMATDRNGLTARQKLLVQIGIAAVASTGLFLIQRHQTSGTDLFWPPGRVLIPLGVLLMPWSTFVICGTSNAVNLTDGLDGLATGCSLFVATSLAALAWLSGHRELAEYLAIPHIRQAGEMTVLLGALTGALLGFLWFNCHPAKVFMGDAGALPVGGLLAFAALVCRQECLLAIIGGVFVAETVSVIVQVSIYRMTGRRILRCSPLHNHFVFRGDHESSIVIRFWIVSAVAAMLGMGTLALR